MRPLHLHSMVLALTALAGCASKPELPKDRYGLAAQPQIYVVHHTARRTFLVERKGDVAGGVLLGGAVGIAAVQTDRTFRSARLQQALDLQDPAPYLKNRLAESLRRDLGLTNLRIEAEALDFPVVAREPREPLEDSYRSSVPGGPPQEKPQVVVPDASKEQNTFRSKHPTGAVIEVVTQHWGMEDYRMKYLASVRLFDLAGSKVLLGTRCNWVVFEQIDLKELPRPTGFDAHGRYDPDLLLAYSEAVEARLRANNGALLKASLRKAAEVCADQVLPRFITGRKAEKE